MATKASKTARVTKTRCISVPWGVTHLDLFAFDLLLDALLDGRTALFVLARRLRRQPHGLLGRDGKHGCHVIVHPERGLDVDLAPRGNFAFQRLEFFDRLGMVEKSNVLMV